MAPRRKDKVTPDDLAALQWHQGYTLVDNHPMFAPLLAHASVFRRKDNMCPKDGWALVTRGGQIHVHPTRRAAPEEWAYVLAHCLLHLGFGHFQVDRRQREWNVVCDLAVATFLAGLKLGRPPQSLPDLEMMGRDEERLYATLCENGIPDVYLGCGVAGPHTSDMDWNSDQMRRWGQPLDWQAVFGQGLAAAVTSAVQVAGGRAAALGANADRQTMAQTARAWFVSSFPLLGALAASFEIVEDPVLCQRLSIAVAAVDVADQVIYINPAAGLTPDEHRFVMAHELLHVGLAHHTRCQGRDPFLWNVACDFIINGWLVEMRIGDLPQVGGLYDPKLVGEFAEAVYDRIVTDMRRFRKLATLRGVGAGDILVHGTPDWASLPAGSDLDDFYRRSLSQGLAYHEELGRGFLPADMVEEIRALSQPPIPWDVALARWFDRHLALPEHWRTYARASRRQSSTPDIPRPRWVPVPESEDGRTFGVVLDTSGSMNTEILAKALGTIASYSMAREVPAVRVVCCDAATYDLGYLEPEAISDRVQIRGRGGTILQPAIDLLEAAADFPQDGPLLIITDGQCDRLRVRRSHGYVLPEGRHLPFVPRGPIFRIQ